jgi:hypothetical protein
MALSSLKRQGAEVQLLRKLKGKFAADFSHWR